MSVTRKDTIEWIASYNPNTGTVGTHVTVPQPSSLSFGHMDLSASDAGRTESADAYMYKHRLGMKVKLELKWSALTAAQAHTLFDVFSNEYLAVRHYSPLGTASDDWLVTKYFYSGDRTAGLYNASRGLWESFTANIVER